MTSRKLIIFCLVLFYLTALVHASQDTNEMFLLGPGVVVTDKPYKGVDTSIYPIPLVKYISGRFYISGATTGYRLAANEGDSAGVNQTEWSLDAIGRFRFDGYDADDSGRLNGMHNRNQTIDVGGEFTLTGDWGEVWVSIITDAFGQHDGQEIKLGFTKPFTFDKLTLSPSGGIIWLSNNLSDYYYGVRADEARPGRPAFHVGDSTNWFVGLRAEYQYNESWTLMAGATYQFLDSKIRKSPIVDDSFIVSFLAGAMYKF